MRILKGYSKDEEEELKKLKKALDINDLLSIITSNLADTDSVLIRIKYYKAGADKQISIIKDILDLYTGEAKFAKPKKYYIHLIKGDEKSYLNIALDGAIKLANNSTFDDWKTKFTYDEVIAINPKFVPFMEEAEDDE